VSGTANSEAVQLTDWRSWTLYEWSDALLAHYFGIETSSEPVEALVVVGEELAVAAGDVEADPASVREALIRKVLRGVGENNFWLHAEERSGGAKPYYLAHLTVACLAATDIAAIDEKGYLDHLEELTEPTNGQLNVQIMAELWRKLATWLADRPDEYRRLILPDQGGWTRIGYTVRLAFPTRRDLRSLTQCLSDGELLVPDPPVGFVIAAVGSAGQTEFTQRFRSEFDFFRQKHFSGVLSSELRMSPFWLAVRCATGGTAVSREASAGNWAILASDDEYELELSLVTRGGASSVAISCEELVDPVGPWTHQAVIDGDADLALQAVFEKRTFVPGVSQLVRAGLVPLMEALHGELESTTHRELFPDAHAALVREDLVEAVEARFGSRAGRARSCDIKGWRFVDQLSLRVLTTEELRGTLLEGCWILYESPSPDVLRLIDGVRVGSAWLGRPWALPAVEVSRADSVTAHAGTKTISLNRVSDSRWTFPPATYDGTVTLAAERASYPIRGAVHFVPAPSVEAYRSPGSPASWVYEDQARARTFRDRFTEDRESLATITDAEPTVYLGRDIGVFASDRTSAAWAVVRAGHERRVYPLLALDAIAPTGQVAEASARRLWRKLLAPDKACTGQADVRAVLAAVVAKSGKPDELPIVDAEAPKPTSEQCGVVPHPRLDDVIISVASISNNRAGFDWRWFAQLLSSVLGADLRLARRIMRAWQEAQLLDELVNVRWSGRRLVAMRPRFIVFRGEHGARATLVGLTLRSTLQEIASRASGTRLTATASLSLSPFVPCSLTLQAEELGPIEELAEHFRIPMARLGDQPFRTYPGRDLRTSDQAPSIGYEREQAIFIGGSCIERRWRTKAPALWTVKSAAFSTWTHFFEAARLWGNAFNGDIDIQLQGRVVFSLASCYLPLTSARWLAAAGGLRSGPSGADSTHAYLYASSTPEMRTSFLAGLHTFIAASLGDMRRDIGGSQNV
jgi:hypothetical protein